MLDIFNKKRLIMISKKGVILRRMQLKSDVEVIFEFVG